MKQFLFLFSIFIASPVIAQSTPALVEKHLYRPFRYETPCLLEQGIQTYPDTCVVVETREKGGALRTRNIYSNKHGLTIKGRLFEYKWEYKVGGNQELGAWTYVMPGFLVQNVSWD